jgi:hypothetical protein
MLSIRDVVVALRLVSQLLVMSLLHYIESCILAVKGRHGCYCLGLDVDLTCMLLVTTGMGMQVPYRNGLHLLPRTHIFANTDPAQCRQYHWIIHCTR